MGAARMKKTLLLTLPALAGIVLSGVSQAGTIEPVLQATLQGAEISDEIPVIIRFKDAVDIDELRKDFAQAAKYRNPVRGEMRREDRALKRRMIVHRLRERALNSQQSTLDWLKQQGHYAEMQSLWSINAVSGAVSASVISELAALPGVESVVLDAVVPGPVPAAVPTSPTNWNLDAIGAPDVWNLGYTGQGIVVGTMDSGVDASHPDLAPRYRGGANSWYDPYGQHATPADHSGHGTQVMGLIVGGESGGYQIGVAPDAQWIAAKIFNDSNEAVLSNIHAAFQWMLDPDGNPDTDDAPDIVNNSWVLANTVNQCNQEFTGDIDLLKEAEIAVVFSGGNFGPDANTSVTPANDVGSLPVGAVDDLGNISNFSSRGANACDGDTYPHLVAPGENIFTTEPAPALYNVVSGTSFSAAHVSGAMAVLKSAFPAATATELESALTESATDIGPVGPDDSSGYGMVDMVGAYNWLSDAGAEGPGTLQFSTSRYRVAENVATISTTVSRTAGSVGSVSIDFASRDGTALAAEDYQATSGTLTFLDGETSQTITISILDDALVEGDENFSLLLSNATGGARLGRQTTANVDITDDDEDVPPPPPPGPTDNDNDGFADDVDCDDADASIHPGAVEISGDGIDQDCNGYDLNLRITKAKFKREKAYVHAASELNSEANLTVTFHLEDGSSVTKPMTWRSRYGRWQKSISRFSYRLGSPPVSITVSGVEGEVSAFMNGVIR
jgi:serine protease AprX